MSKHNRDYTKFSHNKPEENVTEAETTMIDPGDVLEESNESVAEVVLETVNQIKNGVVVYCRKLNVREAPNANANVVCVVDVSTNLVVYEDESTDDFYAVCTAGGAEGYCMKQFVKILP